MTLRNLLTTAPARIGKLATMSKTPINRRRKPAGAVMKEMAAEIHARRQPRRPHYLARLMELRGIGQSDLVKATGADKSQVSRWLDEDNPSTPGREWAQKLGQFFAVAPDYDPVDIFADPDLDWLARLLRGRSDEERDRIRAMVAAAFPRRAS